jgi:hypothetical protein
MTDRDDSPSSEAGNYASVSGLDMYYEIDAANRWSCCTELFRQSAPRSEGRGRRVLGSSRTASFIAPVRLP